MNKYRFARLLLVADLTICSLWMLCINHELYFVPLLTMLLLVRIWVSFSTYRRSRMAVCPLVLLAGMTINIWAKPYGMSYDLFLMPLITLARGALSLFGADRGAVDTLIGRMLGIGWNMQQIINTAATFISVWLLILPLGVYIRRAITKQLRPGRLTLCKNIGLCVYMLGILLLMNILHESNVKIALFFLALFLIPLVFNRAKVNGLFSRSEIAFMATLVLLAAGYVCGVGMEEKSMITASLLPAAFYALVNWRLRREIRYREIATIVIGSVCFAGAQYTTGAVRVSLLLLAAVLTAAVAIRFAAETRKYLAGAGLFVMTALIIPVLCIGYNPYTVISAKRSYACKDYTQAPNGLMYVRSKNCMGIRDRFGIVLPAEYRKIQILRHWMPYFKVGKEGAWQIYDIERHELVSEEVFSDVVSYNDTTFVLKSEVGDRYLILPEHYNRLVQEQQATMTDEVPSAKEKISDN